MDRRDEEFLRDSVGRGRPKPQGGWVHWAVGLGALVAMAVAWALTH